MIEYSANSLAIYKKLYFAEGETTPEETHERVARFLATNEDDYQSYLRIQNENVFRGNTPIYINSNSKSDKLWDKQLCACHVCKLEDSMESILNLWDTCSKIYASGAGAGMPITNLREKGSFIGNGKGIASGPIEYIKVQEVISKTVRSGGRARRSANLATMWYQHPQILELIRCKRDYDLSSFNVSIMLDDFFLEQIESGKDFVVDLISPNKKRKVGEINGRELWDKVIENAHATGDPGIFYYTTANKFNPFPSYSDIHCGNPCLIGDAYLFDENRMVKIKNGGNSFVSWKTGIKNTIKLTLSNGKSIQLTKDHKLKMPSGVDICAENSLGMSILDTFENRYYNGDITKIKRVENIGYLYGDGYVCGCDFGISVKIDRNKEPDVYNRLIEFGMYEQKCKNLYKNIRQMDIEEIEIGLISQKCGSKKLPDEIMTRDVDWIASFLCGLFSANGTMLDGKGQRVCHKDSSKKLIEQIQILLSLFGIRSYITTNKPKEIKWNNGVYTSKESYDVNVTDYESLLRFRKYIGFIEGWKNDRLNNVLKKKKKGHKVYSKVIKIEECGVEEVYDFTMNDGVPYNNANGLIVHNCLEVPLPPNFICVLGSINLNKIYNNQYDYDIDWVLFQEYIVDATRFLNDVVDKTSYVTPEFEHVMKKYRPIGIGLMGWSDLLFKIGIPYNSEKAINLFEKICQYMTHIAIEESIRLAEKNGSIEIPDEDAEHFTNLLMYYLQGDPNNFIERFKKSGIRNCVLTSIAPTGSISISADCSYSFEPAMAICYQKTLAESGDVMSFINPIFEEWLDKNRPIEKASLIRMIADNGGSLRGLGFPKEIEDVFVTAHDIKFEDKVKMQASGQKYIMLGISSTCNLPNSATKEDVEKAYLLGWKSGLKGMTVFRDGCLGGIQPISFGKKECKEEKFEKYTRPIKRSGETYEIKTPDGSLYITVNKDGDRPIEVFLRMGKQGNKINLLIDALSRCISKGLQNEVPLSEFANTLRGNKEDTFYFRLDENQETPYQAESVIDAIGIILDYVASSDSKLKLTDDKGMMYEECPVCHKFTLSRSSGCRSGLCIDSDCGFTSCG